MPRFTYLTLLALPSCVITLMLVACTTTAPPPSPQEVDAAPAIWPPLLDLPNQSRDQQEISARAAQLEANRANADREESSWLQWINRSNDHKIDTSIPDPTLSQPIP